MVRDYPKCANVSPWENGREAEAGLQRLRVEHNSRSSYYMEKESQGHKWQFHK